MHTFWLLDDLDDTSSLATTDWMLVHSVSTVDQSHVVALR